MAQFDVYLNPQPAARERFPFVVQVQSDFLDKLPTRLVMPLSVIELKADQLPSDLTPVFRIRGQRLALMPHLAAPLPKNILKKPVESLPDASLTVAKCFDAVLSGL
jgi:toxin CcdB